MKKLFLFTLLILLFSDVYNQGWIFSRSSVAEFIEPVSSIVTNNGIYVHGSFRLSMTSPASYTSYGSRDLILTKYNLNGVFQWSRRTGSDSVEIPKSIVADANNNIYVIASFSRTCYFESGYSLTSSGGLDFFLAKYNPEGELLWAKNVGRGSGAQTPADLIIDEDNNLVITGYFKNKLIVGDPLTLSDTLTGNSYYSPFISKFSNDGNLIWAKNILTNNNNTYFRKISPADDGYYLSGTFQGTFPLDIGAISSFSNTEDLLLYKIDKNGNGIWVRKMYGNRKETLRSLKTDEFQNAYILGSYTSDNLTVDSTSTKANTFYGNQGGEDSFIAKYNRNGVLQWLIKRGSSSDDGYNDISIRNNLICATGYFTDILILGNDTLHTSGVENSDAFFALFNEIGDPINAVSIIGSGNYSDEGDNVLIDSKSQAIVIGNYRSPLIEIGNDTYTNPSFYTNEFFAIYQQPFKAVITDERMVSCNGLNDGMLTVTPYFGKPPYTYSWNHNTSLNNPVADNLVAATYTVTITDANDSIASISGVVTQAAALAINSIITPVTCYNNGQDGAIDITVSGGTKKGDYSYYWTTINGNGIVPLNQDQTGLAAGTYTVQVKDDNQCTATEDFTVLQPAPFNFSASDTTHIISPDIRKGSIDLEVTGGNVPYASFAWTGPSGYTASSEDIGNLGNVGIYTVTLTDSKGCVADTAFTILDNLTMFAEISAKTDVVCFGDNNGSATVTVHNGTPTYSYKWDDEPTPRSAATRDNMGPGIYYVTVTDGALNVSLPTKVVISSPSAALEIDLTAQNLRCANDNSGVINLTVTGGKLPYSYAWSNGYNGEDLVNVAAGDYTITVTDKFGCTVQDGKTITQPAALWIDLVNSGAILCHGDRSVDVTANVTGGLPSKVYPHFNFVWDDPGTQTTPTAYDLGAGTYNVTITDSNQCSMTTAVIINEPNELSYTAVVTDPSCPGLSDGSIVITPVGGTGPGYEFIWDNSIHNRINSSIPAGRYILTMNDVNYCTLIDTFFLADPEPLEIVSVNVTDVSCENLNSGSITITASGGSGVYDYSVDGGALFFATSTISSLAVGDYEVCGLVIYNAFSPNDDGINEEWNIGSSGSFPNIKVNIFNIWGKEVFSSKGYAEPWDGTYNGNDLPAGTYYYVIDPGDGSDVLSGDVSIVK